MIPLGVSALIVVAIVVALRNLPPGGYPKSHLVLSAAPLLLTIIVPLPFVLPFALAHDEPPDWARTVVKGASVAGIVLSFLLFAIGTALTIRATRAGGGGMTRVLAMETALASVPAAIFSVYATVMLL